MERDFPAAERILEELLSGPRRKRVGIRPDGKAPAREGTEIVSADGVPIGKITSGGFGPSAGAPIAMGYVDQSHSALGAQVEVEIRGRKHDLRVTELPFVPHTYHRP